MGTGYIVRYGVTRNVAEFSCKGSQTFARNAPVIVRSERGGEWGQGLSAASDQTRA